MEAGADFEQARHAPAKPDATLGLDLQLVELGAQPGVGVVPVFDENGHYGLQGVDGHGKADPFGPLLDGRVDADDLAAGIQ